MKAWKEVMGVHLFFSAVKKLPLCAGQVIKAALMFLFWCFVLLTRAVSASWWLGEKEWFSLLFIEAREWPE